MEEKTTSDEFLERLRMYVNDYQSKTINNHILCYFSLNNIQYLLSLSNNIIDYCIIGDNGCYKYQVEVIYSKNNEFIGTSSNSIIPEKTKLDNVEVFLNYITKHL